MTKEIQLTRGFVTLVDDEDFEELNKYKWHASYYGGKTFYAETHTGKMHRILLGVSDNNYQVDHIDGDGLNNCKSNLRIVTNSQNQANKFRASRKGNPKGVTKYNNKWGAKIICNRVVYYLGVYNTQEEAAAAYDKKANELFGDYFRSSLDSSNKYKTRYEAEKRWKEIQ